MQNVYGKGGGRWRVHIIVTWGLGGKGRQG
jgi:hypothetical protein